GPPAAAERAGRAREVPAFLDDMEARVAAADLVVCRSGATTCAELTVAGKAAVLVPFAQAAADHQRVNAAALQSAGAARMVEEKDLTGETLARAIVETLTAPGRLEGRGGAARAAGRPRAGRARSCRRSRRGAGWRRWKTRRARWAVPTRPRAWRTCWSRRRPVFRSIQRGDFVGLRGGTLGR